MYICLRKLLSDMKASHVLILSRILENTWYLKSFENHLSIQSFGITEIDINELTYIKQIEQGGFSKVCLCFLEHYGLVAVKYIKRVLLYDIQHELRTYYSIGSHDNIVSFIGLSRTKKYILIIMDHCSNGNLINYLNSEKSFKQRIYILIQILLGLNFMHTSSPPVVHRDIKPQNIVIDSDDNCKICDMGLSMFQDDW